MAYSGSTQLSSIANPPVLLARGISAQAHTSQLSTSVVGKKQGSGIWFYSSTNLTTDLTAANFFTDGYYLGMQAGDIVMGNQYSSLASSITSFQATVVQVTTNGAQISTGSLISSTYNST